MIRNYLKIAFRNLFKNKGYSIINIAGLSLGFAVCFLIIIFLEYHLDFDKHNKNFDQIYRVAIKQNLADETIRNGNMQGPLASALVNEIPGVKSAVRLRNRGKTLVQIGNKSFYNDEILYTDPSFFRIFSYPIIRGNTDNILNHNNDIVLTKETADKYFPNENPIGKQITLNENEVYTVSGIINYPPQQSHISFSMLINTPKKLYGLNVNEWNKISGFYTYILLNKKVKPESILSQIPVVLKGKLADKQLQKSEFYLQPLKDIHLKSDLNWELFPGRIFDIRYVYIFALIGAFILLIACINYINLATARATTRLKEVGVRKVSGAKSKNLFWQFTGESILLTVFAAIISVCLAEILLPLINSLMDLDLSSNLIRTPWFIALFFIAILFIGTLSGIYPSLILSSFKPSDVFKGKAVVLSKGKMRKGLVILQFAISMILIICTFIIYRQLNFFQNLNLGLNPAQVLNISLETKGEQHAAVSFVNRLKANSNIVNICQSTSIPEKGGVALYLSPNGKDAPVFPVNYNQVDNNYLKTLGIKLLSGREIRIEDANREDNIALINEAGIKKMGWTVKEAIGKKFDRFKIIGVVNNFHFKSFENKISPAIMVPIGNNLPEFISVRLPSNGISATMETIKEEWKRSVGDYPFSYSFLDDTFESLYRSEMRLGNLFVVFSVVAISIACLGLLGLMAFITSSRTKEIGIRKVLGASFISLVKLLARDFIRLVMIGFLLSVPVTWIVMNKWLDNFAYRTEINLWIYLISGVFTFLLAFITVSTLAIRAAKANPVESLKYE